MVSDLLWLLMLHHGMACWFYASSSAPGMDSGSLSLRIYPHDAFPGRSPALCITTSDLPGKHIIISYSDILVRYLSQISESDILVRYLSHILAAFLIQWQVCRSWNPCETTHKRDPTVRTVKPHPRPCAQPRTNLWRGSSASVGAQHAPVTGDSLGKILKLWHAMARYILLELFLGYILSWSYGYYRWLEEGFEWGMSIDLGWLVELWWVGWSKIF